MMTCPRGCDAIMEYVGIDDGFGHDGDLACDVYECPACGEQVIGDCVEDDLVHFHTRNHSPESGSDYGNE